MKDQLSISKERLVSLEAGPSGTTVIEVTKSGTCRGLVQYVKLIVYLELALLVGWAVYSLWQFHRIELIDEIEASDVQESHERAMLTLPTTEDPVMSSFQKILHTKELLDVYENDTDLEDSQPEQGADYATTAAPKEIVLPHAESSETVDSFSTTVSSAISVSSTSRPEHTEIYLPPHQNWFGSAVADPPLESEEEQSKDENESTVETISPDESDIFTGASEATQTAHSILETDSDMTFVTSTSRPKHLESYVPPYRNWFGSAVAGPPLVSEVEQPTVETESMPEIASPEESEIVPDVFAKQETDVDSSESRSVFESNIPLLWSVYVSQHPDSSESSSAEDATSTEYGEFSEENKSVESQFVSLMREIFRTSHAEYYGWEFTSAEIDEIFRRANFSADRNGETENTDVSYTSSEGSLESGSSLFSRLQTGRYASDVRESEELPRTEETPIEPEVETVSIESQSIESQESITRRPHWFLYPSYAPEAPVTEVAYMTSTPLNSFEEVSSTAPDESKSAELILHDIVRILQETSMSRGTTPPFARAWSDDYSQHLYPPSFRSEEITEETPVEEPRTVTFPSQRTSDWDDRLGYADLVVLPAETPADVGDENNEGTVTTESLSSADMWVPTSNWDDDYVESAQSDETEASTRTDWDKPFIVMKYTGTPSGFQTLRCTVYPDRFQSDCVPVAESTEESYPDDSVAVYEDSDLSKMYSEFLSADDERNLGSADEDHAVTESAEFVKENRDVVGDIVEADDENHETIYGRPKFDEEHLESRAEPMGSYWSSENTENDSTRATSEEEADVPSRFESETDEFMTPDEPEQDSTTFRRQETTGESDSMNESIGNSPSLAVEDTVDATRDGLMRLLSRSFEDERMYKRMYPHKNYHSWYPPSFSDYDYPREYTRRRRSTNDVPKTKEQIGERIEKAYTYIVSLLNQLKDSTGEERRALEAKVEKFFRDIDTV